jgi:hypothetical protein
MPEEIAPFQSDSLFRREMHPGLLQPFDMQV